jgi:hypothetical protein
MEHIADGLTISSLTTNATSALSAIGPYLTLILGILLALYVLGETLEMLKQKKDKDE